MKAPKDSKITVCGIARDVEDAIVDDIKRIEKALACFDEFAFVVVESLSKDKTLASLGNLQKSMQNFTYESISHSPENLLKRSTRMAEARNAALNLQRSLHPDTDFVYVLDLDGVNRDLTNASVLSCWEFDDWSVMTSNQPLGYYDILALRHDYWCPVDWGVAYEELIKYFPKETASYISVFSKSVKIDPNNSLIPVKSAFGGGAIYTADSLKDRRYSGLDNKGQEICEHVPLNLDIHDAGGSIYINPKLINVRHLGRSRTIRRRFKDRLNSSTKIELGKNAASA